jgi:Ser/Thr protein kinase RdoA (MazF antagonist)
MDTPAHKELIPASFFYQEYEDAALLLQLQQNGFAALKLLKANYNSDSPIGYYKIILEGEKPLFMRIARPSKKGQLLRANVIARQIEHHKNKRANDLTFTANYLIAAIDYMSASTPFFILIYPWLDGNLLQNDSLESMQELGANLAYMHNIMKDIPATAIKQRTNKHFEALETALKRYAPQSPYTDILQAWENYKDIALENRQLIHNDLHRGNIIFDNDNALHFLDFEEACTAYLNPVLDISWIAERFCLIGDGGLSASEKFSAFIEKYAAINPKLPHEDIAAQIKVCIKVRSYYCLALIHEAKSQNPLTKLDSEEAKFKYILHLTSDKNLCVY